MKHIIRGFGELTASRTACLAASLGLGLLLSGCASDRRPLVVGTPMTLPGVNEYCAVAQKEIASSRVPARNVVMTDYQAFARAKPSTKPLETMQYVGYADDKHTKPRMISCKLHSADRIRAAYGATAAGESTTCARLNRRTLDAVLLSLTDRQRKKMPFKGTVPVMLDADDVASTEAQWHETFTMAQTDAGGTLRIRAKSLREAAPVRVGTKAATAGGGQYCHLIAPDYLKRILTGEVQLPRAEFPEGSRSASR
jgi:hypothetical protein